MACACAGKNGSNRTASGSVSGTYRVLTGDPERQVYESTNQAAAETVAARFTNARILAPGQSA